MSKYLLSIIRTAPLRCTVHVLLSAAIVVSAANGQQSSRQLHEPLYGASSASLPIAISRLKKGDFGPLDIEVIAKWRGVQAVPVLKIQFKRSKDSIIKGKIANALVRLGDKNGPYWDYLVDQVRHILVDGPPTPFSYDSAGNAMPGASKKLVEWAKKHNLSVHEANNDAIFEAQASIIELATTSDRRAIPILREALGARNNLVKAAAARGLAALDDTASIPLIIQVCKESPREAASSIAQSLVFFNDPAAQRAVDQYVSKGTAQVLREAVAHGKTPYD